MISFQGIYGHLLSYENLTTLLISLTMEETPSGINSQCRRQVNKGVLEIAHQYPCHKAIGTRKKTVCPFRQSYVHRDEIIRDIRSCEVE